MFLVGIAFLIVFALFLRWDEKETKKYIERLTEVENNEENN